MNINAGIYVLKPKIIKYVKKEKLDMSEFLISLIKKKKRVFAYPLYENWIDVGTKENLESTRKN